MLTPRILIVEDDEALAFEVCASLASQGYDVVGHAASASKALDLAERLSPDLALVDVELGSVLDGVDVVRRLKERPELAVVYITGHSDRATVERAKQTAPVAYLLKPFSERELMVTVELALVRQQLEANLQAERERLRVTLDSIGDAVIATGVDGRVTLLNPVAAQLTGWETRDAIGRPLADVFQLVDAETRARVERPASVASGVHATHALLIARDGQERAIADSSAPILDAQRRTLGAVVVFRDVTQQLRAEQELQRAQRLDAVGVLAGGLAHDFNNLLAVVAASVSFAACKLGSREGAPVELLQRALQACDRATALTQQLLTFSSGGAPVRRSSSLGDLVRSAAEFVLHGSSCRVAFDVAPDLWRVDVDEGQINQVITNLVLNAVEAMPGGGVIQVSCSNRTLDADNPWVCAPGRYVEVTVTDEGRGIPPEIAQRIFEPYFSTKQRGSGLGLAIAYSIAKRHGGALLAESKPDSGSTFRLLVPASTSAPDAVECSDSATEPAPPKGARVLVMDDEDALRHAMTLMLRDYGFEVEAAADGAEAITAFTRAREQGTPFDVVILDLTVRGGMGGRETIQKLLGIDPETRAIATSGYAPDPIMGYPTDYGFVAALPKPYRIDDLTSLVQRTARRSS